ncbi:MAG: nucleotidyltransferase domain-containing protein [Candidatus Methanoplasma sp.]|jgi:predicted nucleotidyltransferase|nr:nucleotidyltransferase domain-containing protein [Candidatus Methanoplasma sp.]
MDAAADAARDFSFEEICEIFAPIARKHGIRRAHLFGSRARGDNRADSDYDFMVSTPAGMGLIRLGSFLCDLEDAFGPNVDLATEGAMYRLAFIREFLRDGRLVFEE